MPRIIDLTSLVTCAIASDGGTIHVVLSDAAGGISQFKINRRIADRGTSAFNRVSTYIDDEQRMLSDSDLVLLRSQLHAILLATDSEHSCYKLLATFVQHLSEASLP